MTTVGLQERVKASQMALDYLYAACRDAAPGSDEARRACWDYQRGQEQHAQLLQAVQQWDAHVQQVGRQMQQQGNAQMQRGLHPPEPQAPPLPAIRLPEPPKTVHCTTSETYGGYGPIETICR